MNVVTDWYYNGLGSRSTIHLMKCHSFRLTDVSIWQSLESAWFLLARWGFDGCSQNVEIGLIDLQRHVACLTDIHGAARLIWNKNKWKMKKWLFVVKKNYNNIQTNRIQKHFNISKLFFNVDKNPCCNEDRSWRHPYWYSSITNGAMLSWLGIWYHYGIITGDNICLMGLSLILRRKYRLHNRVNDTEKHIQK